MLHAVGELSPYPYHNRPTTSHAFPNGARLSGSRPSYAEVVEESFARGGGSDGAALCLRSDSKMPGDVEIGTSHATREAGKERVEVAVTCHDKSHAQLQIGPGAIKREKRSRAGLPPFMCLCVEKRRGVEADCVDQPLHKQSRVMLSLNKGRDA